MVVNVSKTKSLKIALYLIKYIPYILCVGYVLYTMLSFYFNVDILGYIFHVSIIQWLLLFILSICFKFCTYHRIPLYYIFLNDGITIFDFYIKIPLCDFSLLIFHSILLGLFVIIYMYCYVKRIDFIDIIKNKLDGRK